MALSGFCVVSLQLFSCAAALLAQDRIAITPRGRPEAAALAPRTNLRFDVQMVQIPVTVTDQRGKPLDALRRGAFRLFEDDVERPITAFSISDAPISATLIFDTSRSMKTRIAEARSAAEQFLHTSARGDEFSLVRFSDKAELLAGYTQDEGEISRQLNLTAPHGWTALFDAVCLAVQGVRTAHNQRRVLVVFSDGADNNSRYSESELISLLREADVRVYAVGMIERPKSLERITEDTGGRALWVKKLEDLPAAMENLSRQIRSEYSIGYSPGTVRNDGKYHRIRIEVEPPAGMARVYASWRRGYTAPGE